VTPSQIAFAVDQERQRQRELFADGKIPFECSSPKVHPAIKLAVLTEEVGEVAKEVLPRTGDLGNLKTELVQVMAVCHAWLESL